MYNKRKRGTPPRFGNDMVRRRSAHLPWHVPNALEARAIRVLRRVLATAFYEAYADLTGLVDCGQAPAIIISNHTSTYDGLLAMIVSAAADRHLWVPSAPSVLRRQPYLRPFGWFTVERGDPNASQTQLRAVATKLTGKSTQAIWFFPEGCIVRNGISVTPQRGALMVSRWASDAVFVPVAIRVEHFERARPFAWVKTCEPMTPREVQRIGLRQALDLALDALHADLMHGGGQYRGLLRDDSRTMLVRNVPCDLAKVATALNGDLEFARRIMCGHATRDERSAAAREIGRVCGPLYRQLATPTAEDASPS